MKGATKTTVKYIPHIRCFVRFYKDKNNTQAWLNLANKINVINFAAKQGFPIRKIEIRAQKINESYTSLVYLISCLLLRKICISFTSLKK